MNDLATVLEGLNKTYSKIPDYPFAVIIVVDNDDRNTDAFRAEMVAVAEAKNVTIDHVFCIAIEEMEAWLLGDKDAVKSAYPHVKMEVLRSYRQDSICGTWEVLADAIYKGGAKKLKQESYFEIGRMKLEWAQTIGAHMDITKNESPSFQYFISEVQKRFTSAA